MSDDQLRHHEPTNDEVRKNTERVVELNQQTWIQNETFIRGEIGECGGIAKWDDPIPYGGLDVGDLMRKVWLSPVDGQLISYITKQDAQDFGYSFRCMSFVEMVILHSFSRNRDLMNYPRVKVSGFRDKQHVQAVVQQSNDKASVQEIINSGILRKMIANAEDVPDERNERELSGLQLSYHRVTFIDRYMKCNE